MGLSEGVTLKLPKKEVRMAGEIYSPNDVEHVVLIHIPNF